MDINDIKNMSSGYSLFPLCKKLTKFNKSPAEIFLILRGLSNHCFILESAENTCNARYTFIGFEPDMEITVKNHVMTINGSVDINESDPKRAIARIMENNRSPKLPGLPPFTGGLVGFLSFDFIAYEEPTLPLLSDDGEFNDIDLMMFKRVIAFDRKENCCYLIINIKTDHIEENYNRANYELEHLSEILHNGIPIVPQKLTLLSEFVPDMERYEFCKMVEQAKQYIREGDIFQIVLSNRLYAKASGSLFEAYEYQKKTNPSPYMLYFSSDEVEIAGSAPETLVSVHDGVVSTFPLAGTRKRGANPKEDKALEAELLADEKERAEHNMLVDLGRNDVGKVSEIGTVKVPRYMDILSFSHVMHIGSEVTGQLREGLSAIDAVSAVIPAGTLSGAPKIRACEIIHELEHSSRGIYGGAIGYLAFSGDADLCIAIRLAYKKGGSVYARSGAGIVADSIPENEYDECNNKLKSVMKSISAVAGGDYNDTLNR
ncbi:MAG: anthranilate synthase component I family protein [Ruminococcus sp.]|jgi:anthranilate synthase component 1|nr:anthranilate synthase component I family protein [Ruminococcus sp.]